MFGEWHVSHGGWQGLVNLACLLFSLPAVQLRHVTVTFFKTLGFASTLVVLQNPMVHVQVQGIPCNLEYAATIASSPKFAAGALFHCARTLMVFADLGVPHPVLMGHAANADITAVCHWQHACN